MAGILSSLRFLLSDLLGIDDSAPPMLPQGLPARVAAIAGDAVAQLIAYQGPGYAQLYVERLQRFARRRDVSETLLAEIAALMARRMAYDDPPRLAQVALEAAASPPPSRHPGDVETVRLDDVVAALPARLFEVPVVGFNWAAVCRTSMSLRVTGRYRLHALAWSRRWRLFSKCYAGERAWVERWLHMIDRALAKQPVAALAVARTATMVAGHGVRYRRGLDKWRAVIADLVKPTLDGVLPLPDLAGVLAEVADADRRDPNGGLERAITAIRARALAAADEPHMAPLKTGA